MKWFKKLFNKKKEESLFPDDVLFHSLLLQPRDIMAIPNKNGTLDYFTRVPIENQVDFDSREVYIYTPTVQQAIRESSKDLEGSE